MRILLFFSLSFSALAATRTDPPAVFEKNVGQSDAQVRYLGRAGGAGLYLLDSGAVLRLGRRNRQTVLKMTFKGARPHPFIKGARALEGHANYFIGSDPSKWRTGVALFGEVVYKDVYPGIDLQFHGQGPSIEYDWIVAPGADPRAIRMSFQGTDRIALDHAGNLTLHVGEVRIGHKRPTLYQDGHEVAGRFVRRGRDIGFEVDSYDRARPLNIDPVVTYAT